VLSLNEEIILYEKPTFTYYQKQRRIFILYIAIYLGFLGSVALDSLGISIPGLRQFLGFICLGYIPGQLILKAFRIKDFNTWENLIFSVGLSVLILMCIGALINYFYPFMGINRPISFYPLIITFIIAISVLFIITYRNIDRENKEEKIQLTGEGEILPQFSCFLKTIPAFIPVFLSIFGTYILRYYHNNIFLLLLFLAISLVIVYVTLLKDCPKFLYPLTLFLVSLSLLYHYSLLSPYLSGWDIHIEYYFQQLVKENGIWNFNTQGESNALLSVIMLNPIFSLLLDLTGTQVYKIIYPLIFSFAIIGLYEILRKQLDEKTSFLSCFFFMAFNLYYSEMLGLTRQMICELFFVLVIICILNKNISQISKRSFFVIFSFGMIVSHYGLTWIFLGYLILYMTILNIIRISKNQEIYNNDKYNSINNSITVYSFAIFFVLAITWHMYLANANNFTNIILIGNNIINNINFDLFNKSTKDAEVLMFLNRSSATYPSIWREITKYLYYLTQFFIVVGFLNVSYSIIKTKKIILNLNYYIFSIISMFILFLCIILPYFASSLHMTRFYHITLFFLCPFFILGCNYITNSIGMLLKSIKTYITKNINIIASLLILILYFLFNSGFIYEIVGDAPASLPLGYERFIKSKDNFTKASFYRVAIQEEEYTCAIWMKNNCDKSKTVYGDPISNSHVIPAYAGIYLNTRTLLPNAIMTYDKINGYVYLNKFNIKDKLINWVPTNNHLDEKPFSINEVNYIFKDKNRIYQNGGSDLYY